VPIRALHPVLIASTILFSMAAAKAPAGTHHRVAAAPPIDPCALLTDNQVSDVIEMRVDPGFREDTGRLDSSGYQGSYSATCVWMVRSDSASRDSVRPWGKASFAVLAVISWPAGSEGPAEFLQSFRDAADSQLIPSSPLPLHIGDEALWWGDGVAARKGNISFGISVHLVQGRSKERAMEEVLTRAIVSHLSDSD
jgi:hypothetical protein